MFTSRGYRHSKRENRHVSRQGQIIQQKPSFQIDNNPLVVEAYKKFILGGEILLRPIKLKEEFICTLSEFDLTWTSSNLIESIKTKLVNFAEDIFQRFKAINRYPISLELYSPNSISDNVWSVQYIYSSSNQPYILANYNKIIIDIQGNLSFSQNYTVGYYQRSTGTYSADSNYLTLGYGLRSQNTRSTGNPATMVMDVYYFPFFT